MAVKLSPIFQDAQLDASGNPWTGAKLFTYTAGSSTKQTVYQDSAGSSAHTNPIVLNSRGEPPAAIWLTSGVSYKFVLTSPTDSDPPVASTRTVDNVSGINDTTISQDEWVSGPTPTFISTTSFTLVGDQTTAFNVGRRVKTTNSGGTIYSSIITSAFTSLTTVTVANDSGVLDSGLSAVSYALVSGANTSAPLLSDAYPIRGGSADRSKRLRLEVDGFTTATTRVLTPPNADLTLPNAAIAGTIPIASSAGVLGMVAALNKTIYGLTYDNGTDVTNDLNINTGGAMDATGAYWMTLATALGKQSDVAWAVGGTTAAPLGGLDTGAVGNSDYYIWLIARSDTGVVDALYSLSSTAPSMPASYDFKRLIGWFKRVGGTIVAFTTYEMTGGGLELLWTSPTLEVDLASTLTTARRTDAVKVPLNFSTIAQLNIGIQDTSTAVDVWIYCPDQADLAPNPSAAPLGSLKHIASASGDVFHIKVRTSASGTIAARADLATVDNYRVSTMGFEWARRN